MNQKLAEIFYGIADILEMKKVQWKPQAYRKAAKSIEALGNDIKEIYEKQGIKGLKDIPGVGEAIAQKIVEYIQTGKVKHFEKLKNTVPEGAIEMMKVPGVGVKRALKLYNKLGINSVKQLEKYAKEHKIAGLETFREKSEANILEGIELMKKRSERILLGFALPVARKIVYDLKQLKAVKECIAAGSLRRMEETIGDIDILVVADDYKVAEFFTKMPNVKKVLAKGDTKSTIITRDNIQVDLRIVKKNSFGSALQYFTGNKEHNIHLRNITIKKGMKLSEYGLFKGNKQIAGETEEGVYNQLGMPYIEPELRTERGEIEAALKRKLPKIIGYGDINGDLHVHTKWSDGADSIQEMAESAKSLGHKYIAITDHSGNIKISHPLNEKRMEKQIKEIDKVNEKISGIEILKGAEVDINSDGRLAAKDSILGKLDVVIASIHSGFKFPEEKMTERVLKAMDNPHISVIGHPTGRLIQKRQPHKIDLGKIYEKAKETGIALEINAFPDRLDLNDSNVRESVGKGVKLAIGTDSHSKNSLGFIELGTAIARRGWATKKDVLNTLSLKKLRKALRR